jgi:RND superfamily putative drug exporter
MGRAIHWIPRWLDRILPHVDIEGEKLIERAAATDAAAKKNPEPGA